MKCYIGSRKGMEESIYERLYTYGRTKTWANTG